MPSSSIANARGELSAAPARGARARRGAERPGSPPTSAPGRRAAPQSAGPGRARSPPRRRTPSTTPSTTGCGPPRGWRAPGAAPTPGSPSASARRRPGVGRVAEGRRWTFLPQPPARLKLMGGLRAGLGVRYDLANFNVIESHVLALTGLRPGSSLLPHERTPPNPSRSSPSRCLRLRTASSIR
jgi:hypothetical protein